MKTKQAPMHPDAPGSDKTLHPSLANTSGAFDPDLPVIQAGKFDEAEPRLQLGDTADTALVSPVAGILALRRRRSPDGPPVAEATSLQYAIDLWADALEKNLHTSTTGDFDAFLLRQAVDRLVLMDRLVSELAEVEGLDEQLTGGLIARIRAKYPGWRQSTLLTVN